MHLPLLMLVLYAALVACAPSIQRHAPPSDRMMQAVIPNIANARYWRDDTPENLDAIIKEVQSQRLAAGIDRDGAVLALSGGADDGAFGAGLMAAWSTKPPELMTAAERRQAITRSP